MSRCEQVQYSKIALSTLAVVLILGGSSGTYIAQSKRNSVSTNATTPLSAREVFRRFARSVVVVRRVTWDREEGGGSGFVASPDGLVITNAHVVKDAQYVHVRQPQQPTEIEDGLETDLMHGFRAVAKAPAPQPATVMAKAVNSKATLLYVDVKADIAVLKTDLKSAWFDLSITAMPDVGERVYAIGSPMGLENSITEGIVSGIRQKENRWLIQHSAPISHGNSGGALVSERGILVGMNTFSLRESDDLNFAIPAESLKRALAAAQRQAVPIAFPRASAVESSDSSPDSSEAFLQSDFARIMLAGLMVGLLLLLALVVCQIFAILDGRLSRAQITVPDAAIRPVPATLFTLAMARRAWLAGSLLWAGFWGILATIDEGVGGGLVIPLFGLPLLLGPIGLGIYRFIVHGKITMGEKAGR